MRYRLYRKNEAGSRKLVYESENLGDIAGFCGMEKYNDSVSVVNYLHRTHSDLILRCVSISREAEETVLRWMRDGGVLGLDEESGDRKLYLMDLPQFSEAYEKQTLFRRPDEFARYSCRNALAGSGFSQGKASSLMREFMKAHC